MEKSQDSIETKRKRMVFWTSMAARDPPKK